MTQVRNELAQQIDKTLSNLEETAPIDIIEEGEGVLDLEEGMYLLVHQFLIRAIIKILEMFSHTRLLGHNIPTYMIIRTQRLL